MEASSSFVIYGPVFRGDFFYLCSKGLRVTALTAVKQSRPGSRLQNHPIILGSITAQSLGCSLARFRSTAVNVVLTSAQTRLAGVERFISAQQIRSLFVFKGGKTVEPSDTPPGSKGREEALSSESITLDKYCRDLGILCCDVYSLLG